MELRDRSCLALALVCGGCCGFVELHTTEVVSTIVVLLLTGALLGFARPQFFWLWALITGVSVPASYLVARLVGITPREWPHTGAIASYLGIAAFAIAVALFGSGMGALIARATPDTS